MPFEQKGVDVSAWQGDIAWDKGKKAGIQFAMLRAAASTYLDSKFIRNIESASAQGIPVAFDMGDITQHHLTNTQRTDRADAFCRKVAQWDVPECGLGGPVAI